MGARSGRPWVESGLLVFCVDRGAETQLRSLAAPNFRSDAPNFRHFGGA